MVEYVTITSYTLDKHKAAIVGDVRKTSVEEVPMITFVALDDMNQELHDWIDEVLA